MEIKKTTDMEVQAGNKLIAEFDGWELCSNKKKYWWAKPGVTWDCFDPPEFNHNWELLMPVVEKIRNLWNEESLDLQLLEEDDDASKIKHSRVWAEITSVWQAVVQFVKWYNTQNKQS